MTQICNKQESRNLAVTGSSCQQSTRGSFHHRVLWCLEGRPSLSFFVFIIFSPLEFPGALMHAGITFLAAFLNTPTPAHSLHFIHLLPTKKKHYTAINWRDQPDPKTLHCAPGVTANTGGQLHSISSHQTCLYFPPIGRPVDAKVFRSTAELFYAPAVWGWERTYRMS